MGKLIYSTICSLDGYVADEDGRFDWAAPGEEVFAFVNELERPIGTYLYGRRMYDVMAVWETLDVTAEPAVVRDFAEIWRSADKIVFSKTLERCSSSRTQVERDFDPDLIRRLKAASERDITVGGPTLAARAIGAGLVDECHVFLTPVLVGGGTPAFPGGVRAGLELLDERRFGSGVVHLHYHVARGEHQRCPK